jgi:hypothetical protein
MTHKAMDEIAKAFNANMKPFMQCTLYKIAMNMQPFIIESKDSGLRFDLRINY